MQQWTQDEAIEFECAREVITHLRAILTHEITAESSKAYPDAQKLAQLHEESNRLFQERVHLRVKSHAEIARVQAEYGPRIRAWNANHQLAAA